MLKHKFLPVLVDAKTICPFKPFICCGVVYILWRGQLAQWAEGSSDPLQCKAEQCYRIQSDVSMFLCDLPCYLNIILSLKSLAAQELPSKFEGE